MWRVTITLHPLYIYFQDRLFRTTNFAKVSKLLYLSLFIYCIYIITKILKKIKFLVAGTEFMTLRKDLASINGGGSGIWTHGLWRASDSQDRGIQPTLPLLYKKTKSKKNKDRNLRSKRSSWGILLFLYNYIEKMAPSQPHRRI